MHSRLRLSTTQSGRRAAFTCLCVTALACGQNAESDGIAIIDVDAVVADRDLNMQIAARFYQSHDDVYDFLVLWGGPSFTPAYSYYDAVSNDIQGIGYQDPRGELFDDSALYSSRRLQGVIWMGPRWREQPLVDGPEGALWVLAHETAHRWAASVHFEDDEGGASNSLIGSPFHWSFFLHSSASPLGGNDWRKTADGCYTNALPTYAEFCDLDLYLMGLADGSVLGPQQILHHAVLPDGQADTRFEPGSRRTARQVELCAQQMTVNAEQIVAVEGPREEQGPSPAAQLRQAWVYLVPQGQTADAADLRQLAALKQRWSPYYARACRGLGLVADGATY